MQTNKIIQTAILAVLMLLSMIVVSTLLEVSNALRNLILGTGLFAILLSVLWKNIPYDGKLLFIIILGYALGGKGFAYVSPVEPIYIGEITLALCMLGFLLRPRQMSLFDTRIHKLIWIYVIYAGIHLIVDFESYRLLALRDSSMSYYGLYFFAAYSLFHSEKVMRAFERVIKVAIVLSVFSMVWAKYGPGIRFTGLYPHKDAFIPLCIGFALYAFIAGVEKRKIHFLLFACLVSLFLASIKTAAMVAIVAVLCSAVLFGQIKKLVVPALILGLLGIVALSVIAFIDIGFVEDLIFGGETAEAFGIKGGEFVGFSGTSEWRWLWWSTVCMDTTRGAPFWGQGFGADITGPFLEAWLGIDYRNNNISYYSRYPHNIMITVFGRLGFIGLAMFGLLFVSIGIFALKFCRKYFCHPARRDADIICFGIVVAGMVNALLQSTYEAPYAAITHWTCLAYLAARFYLPVQEPDNVAEDKIEAETDTES